MYSLAYTQQFFVVWAALLYSNSICAFEHAFMLLFYICVEDMQTDKTDFTFLQSDRGARWKQHVFDGDQIQETHVVHDPVFPCAPHVLFEKSHNLSVIFLLCAHFYDD